jgi:uncharacterized protein YjbI with pentapeptide repeats
LQFASLRKIEFEEVDVEDADFSGAEVQGANLRGAQNLVQAQVNSMKGDKDTILPASLRRPAKWR